MKINPVAERIMFEGMCPSEINMHNANEIMDWVRDTDRHHTKEDCKSGKNCVHAPGDMTVDWAATIMAEAEHVCICGEHGIDNPEMAWEVVRDFQKRWGKTIGNPKVKR